MASSSSQDAREGVRRRQYEYLTVRAGDLQDQHQNEIRFRIEHVQQLIQPRFNARMQDLGQSQATPPMTTRRLHSSGVGWRTTSTVQDRRRVDSRLWTMICSNIAWGHWILLVAILAIGNSNRAQWVSQRGSSLPWEKIVCSQSRATLPQYKVLEVDVFIAMLCSAS
jgi:hypothetical protein